MKTCKICKAVKPLIDFNPASKYEDKIYYRSECRECNLKAQSSNQTAQIKYRNSEKGSIIKKAYKQTIKYKESQRIYENNRLKENILFRLKKRIRDRTSKAIKSKNWSKSSSFFEYIGCSIEELKNHLEKQFIMEMTWDNYAILWEIDHIIPLGSVGTIEEMYKLAHYTNLKPLQINEHRLKSKEDTKNIIRRKNEKT